MNFKKSPRIKPVVLSPYWRAEQDRKGRRAHLRSIVSLALFTSVVFAVGMTVTNWRAIRSKLPTYYWNCAAARSAGAAPIHRGEPGYAPHLDSDRDGIACEPYRGR